MRRIIIALLALNAGFVGVRLLEDVWAQSAPIANQNGDTNGDGELDLTDAVFILEHLFLGGPAPAALADGGAAVDTTALEARLAAVEAKLAHVTMTTYPDGHGQDVPTLRVTGANLQVVNGTGETGQSPNSAGNVIIGYNGDPTGWPPERTGSHNLVVGEQNNYISWGGIVAGTKSYAKARYASVLGGTSNEVWEEFSTILGGERNIIDGAKATISGGNRNWGGGEHSSVSGGQTNHAAGRLSSILGGENNTAAGGGTTILGGINANWTGAIAPWDLRLANGWEE